MIKRASFLIAGFFLFATVAQAQEKGSDGPATFQLFGTISSYYKHQEDYHTPLDWSVRSGANNRSKQSIRTQGDLTFLSKAGKSYSDTNSEFIGVFKTKMDADDPDHPDNFDENTDGKRKFRVDNGDVWIRYSPMEAVGIKIGTQTITATSLAANVHRYRGDYDEDFIFYSAATLLEMPGITVDLHLSEQVEFGVGLVEGMGDASMIASGGKPSEAKNTVVWFKAEFGNLTVGLASQSIDVGGEEEEEDPSTTHWKQEYNHTVQNLWAKAQFSDFTPYIGYQKISGETVPWERQYGDYAVPGNSYSYGRYTHIEKSRDMEGTFTTVGILAEIGPGQLAVQHTQISTPEYDKEGKDKWISAIIELDTATQLNYTIPIGEGGSISLFYHTLKSKEDSERKKMEAAARGGIAQATQAKEWNQAIKYKVQTRLLESLRWTDSTSYGIQFQIKFGSGGLI